MSFSEREAYQQGLWETFDALADAVCEKAHRAVYGDELFEHSLTVSEEVRRHEERLIRERLEEIRAISEQNRRLK